MRCLFCFVNREDEKSAWGSCGCFDALMKRLIHKGRRGRHPLQNFTKSTNKKQVHAFDSCTCFSFTLQIQQFFLCLTLCLGQFHAQDLCEGGGVV